jgi:hypothetical protein
MDFISMIDDIRDHEERFALSRNRKKLALKLSDETMDRKYPETTKHEQKLFSCQRTNGETATK